MPNISIWVVDDQHLVRMGLTRMLGDLPDMTVIGEYDSGEAVLTRMDEITDLDDLPDVVLMDLRMPGIGGLEATRKLTQRFPEVRVVAVTGCDDAPFPQRFLECGASGFVTKDAGIEEVIKAIHSVFRGKRYICQQIAQEIALHVVRPREEVSPFDKLSERELQITLMVIDGMKALEIAEKLSVSPKTINTYRYRVFEKLRINSNMELALLATRYGLLNAHEKRH